MVFTMVSCSEKYDRKRFELWNLKNFIPLLKNGRNKGQS